MSLKQKSLQQKSISIYISSHELVLIYEKNICKTKLYENKRNFNILVRALDAGLHFY